MKESLRSSFISFLPGLEKSLRNDDYSVPHEEYTYLVVNSGLNTDKSVSQKIFDPFFVRRQESLIYRCFSRNLTTLSSCQCWVDSNQNFSHSFGEKRNSQILQRSSIPRDSLRLVRIAMSASAANASGSKSSLVNLAVF